MKLSGNINVVYPSRTESDWFSRGDRQHIAPKWRGRRMEGGGGEWLRLSAP